MAIPYEGERYHTTSEKLRETLEQYGVAVIPGVLDAAEVASFNEGMWATLEALTSKFAVPVRQDDRSTWKHYFELLPQHSMLMQHFGIGHAQYIWDVRQNPKVAAIFAALWKVKAEQLLVSFDGASVHLPPETVERGWFRNQWLHSDQSFQRNKLESVQAWVTGFDVREGDGTLQVLEGSHRFHAEFARTFRGRDFKLDWYKLADPEEFAFFEQRGCRSVAIACPAGGMVFWDSRTIHCGREPVQGRAQPSIRNVAYICMTPRAWATTKIIEKKRQHLAAQRTTNHWPHRPKLFAKHPQTYGRPLPDVAPLPAPRLTPLGRKLAGH